MWEKNSKQEHKERPKHLHLFKNVLEKNKCFSVFDLQSAQLIQS